jgi:hypothetical protein
LGGQSVYPYSRADRRSQKKKYLSTSVMGENLKKILPPKCRRSYFQVAIYRTI